MNLDSCIATEREREREEMLQNLSICILSVEMEMETVTESQTAFFSPDSPRSQGDRGELGECLPGGNILTWCHSTLTFLSLYP